MGVKSRSTQIGNYIAKINNYDIRQKVTYKKGNEYGAKKPQVATSEYVVCRGRNVIKSGFKSRVEADNYANSN
jgi:hypothetical protein